MDKDKIVKIKAIDMSAYRGLTTSTPPTDPEPYFENHYFRIADVICIVERVPFSTLEIGNRTYIIHRDDLQRAIKAFVGHCVPL